MLHRGARLGLSESVIYTRSALTFLINVAGPITEKADHSYPSSSKKRTNWDQFVQESNQEEEQEGKQRDKDPNAGGDVAVNELFQKLYADATDDQRRAMIKSYQLSNGTSLSTNWEEVAKVSHMDDLGQDE